MNDREEELKKIKEWWELIGHQARYELKKKYFPEVKTFNLNDEQTEVVFYIHVMGF